jgi:4-amino-4-deoxy-L-arabinose transferase-like glycosyltransferase
LIVFAAVFLGFDIASRPIVLWDESRLAVNAMEMSQRGFSLVTTYGFQPDLYNTKPPLLIWLMAGSVRLFGPYAWAIRLPSLVAALATLGLVLRMTWRLSGSLLVMALAGATLVFSQGFFGNHAASSGDYDSLLTLLVTGYLFLLFRLLHQRRPSGAAVMACGLIVAAACLTKGVAGLAPGAGVAVYVLLRGRWRRLFQTPWYLLAGLACVAIVAAYYLAREASSSGYLTAVMNNELSGRYVRGMNGHIRPFDYYLTMLCEQFAFGPAFALPILAAALPWRRTKSAAFVIYADIAIVAVLLVLSFGRTKIFWYLMPVYPILSVAFAVSIQRLVQLAGRGPRWVTRPLVGAADVRHLLVGLAALGVLAYDAYDRVVLTPPVLDNPQAHYGQMFAGLSHMGRRDIRTVDAGVFNNDGLNDYSPQLRFYTLVWRARGLDIRPADPNFPDAPEGDQVLMSCDPNRVGTVGALGVALMANSNCVAVAASAGA